MMTRSIGKYTRLLFLLAVLVLTLFGLVRGVLGGNIDPVDRWTWSATVGWINFDPQCTDCKGVTVYDHHLEGFAWGENIGWIRLGSDGGGGVPYYANSTKEDYGINRDSDGALHGYAWGSNVGWIKFDPQHGRVIIDPITGSFDGYAWGENIGWIHFKGEQPTYNVVGPVLTNWVYLPLGDPLVILYK